MKTGLKTAGGEPVKALRWKLNFLGKKKIQGGKIVAFPMKGFNYHFYWIPLLPQLCLCFVAFLGSYQYKL